jgi:hypothetical protein
MLLEDRSEGLLKADQWQPELKETSNRKHCPRLYRRLQTRKLPRQPRRTWSSERKPAMVVLGDICRHGRRSFRTSRYLSPRSGRFIHGVGSGSREQEIDASGALATVDCSVDRSCAEIGRRLMYPSICSVEDILNKNEKAACPLLLLP